MDSPSVSSLLLASRICASKAVSASTELCRIYAMKWPNWRNQIEASLVSVHWSEIWFGFIIIIDMATYFHGSSEIQADGLQTLYLMNPNYIGYSDTQQPSAANMLFLNATPNSLNPTNLPNMPLQNQHFVGIPLPNMGSANSDDQNRSTLHAQPEMSSLQGIVPRFHYNLWGSTDQNPTGNQPQIPTAVAAASSGGAADVTSQLGLRRQVVSPTQQGLSLSLSPHQPTYRSVPGEHDIQVQQQPPVQAISPTSGDDMRVSGGSSSTASAVSNGISGMQSVLLGSKYLKAAQLLLDEVANVGKGIKTDSGEETKEREKVNTISVAASTGEALSGGESSAKRGAELSTAQRQELQMKKAKLVNMLDEVHIYIFGLQIFYFNWVLIFASQNHPDMCWFWKTSLFLLSLFGLNCVPVNWIGSDPQISNSFQNVSFRNCSPLESVPHNFGEKNFSLARLSEKIEFSWRREEVGGFIWLLVQTEDMKEMIGYLTIW